MSDSKPTHADIIEATRHLQHRMQLEEALHAQWREALKAYHEAEKRLFALIEQQQESSE